MPGPGPRAAAATIALVLAGGAAHAQGADSVAAAAARPPVTSPAAPLEVPPGPLSPGARLVFTRDSIIWSDGYTLADLLAEIPGVSVARTGFAAQPAPALYGGHGTAGIEIVVDGLPLLPLGPDSLAPDPGAISLIGILRVEVERHPSMLRVFLVSERSERLGARSLLRIVNGDFKTAGYAGNFQYRWPMGVGLDLSADYFDTKGGQGLERDAKWFDLRGAVDWTPTPLLSAVFQTRSRSFDREATEGEFGLSVPAREDSRRESLLRLVASTRPHRRGLSFDVGFANTTWQADSGSADTLVGRRSVNRAFAGLRLAGYRGVADLSVRGSDYHTPLEAELRTGWTPTGWLVISGSARWASHEGDRTSKVAQASLGLHGGPFSITGDLRWADAVALPVLRSDTAQRTLDLGARAGFESRRVTLHAGIERREAFAPPGLGSLPALPSLGTNPEANMVLGDVTVNLGPLALSGWYADPVAGGTASFEPPAHVRAAITFRSQFLRTFRSGAFDLKVQVAVESWGAGTDGFDATGSPVALPGASIMDAFLQFELASFHAFYSLKNALRSRDGYVAGFEYPRNRQTFGVKWIFHD